MLVKRYEHFYLKFYNEMSGTDVEKFEDIPERARELLMFIDYDTIVKPFIACDLEKGVTTTMISKRYAVDRQIVRTIGKKYRFCK